MGKTPLHECAYYDKSRAAQSLVDAGAVKAVTDTSGRTPLSIAFSCRNEEVARFLLTADGVSVDSNLSIFSLEMSHIVEEHPRISKLKINRQISRRMGNETSFGPSPEQPTQISLPELSQSQRDLNFLKSEPLELGEGVFHTEAMRDQKPAKLTNDDYDQKTGAGFPNPPSSAGHVDGQDMMDMVRATRSSIEVGEHVATVVATEETPASANQQIHASTGGKHSPEGARPSVLKTVIPIRSGDSVDGSSFPVAGVVPISCPEPSSAEIYHTNSSKSVVAEWPSATSSMIQVSNSVASNERMDIVSSDDLTDRHDCNDISNESLILASGRSSPQSLEYDHRLDEFKKIGTGDENNEDSNPKARKKTRTGCLRKSSFYT